MKRRLVLQLALGLPALAAGCALHRAPGASASADPLDETALAAAFHYAFPLYEFARIAQQRTGAVDGVPRKLNALSHRARLSDHASRQVTMSNNDTIPSSAFLELSGGAVEIEVPSSTERYFSIAFMHAFTDVFAYIGTRATGGRGGRYWLVGPQWQGSSPDGASLIRSPTNDVWMLMRTLVNGPTDLAAAQAFQTRLAVRVPPGRAQARGYSVTARDVTDAQNFLALVNEVIGRSPGGGSQLARAHRFAQQGVASNETPTLQLIEAWRGFIPSALETLREAFLARDLIVDGWSYQPPGVGDFGEDDRLRASVALGGIAALTEDEAMYFHASVDASGAFLTGGAPYVWRSPAGGVPVDAFWSLTAYTATPEGRYFLVENPIGRYSIGDRTPGLIVEPDGSFRIYVQRQRPEGALAANWLPAPEGRLHLVLRAYLPRATLRSRAWRVPPLRVRA